MNPSLLIIINIQELHVSYSVTLAKFVTSLPSHICNRLDTTQSQ